MPCEATWNTLCHPDVDTEDNELIGHILLGARVANACQSWAFVGIRSTSSLGTWLTPGDAAGMGDVTSAVLLGVSISSLAQLLPDL